MSPSHAEATVGRIASLVLFLSAICLAGHATGQAPCPNCRPALPAPPVTQAGEPLTGVESQRIKTGRHTINGHEVTEAEARRAIGAGIPSDSKLPFLVVIGPLASRQRVMNDLSSHRVLSRLRERYRVQDYSPEDWVVTRRGFVATGNPTIYIESPTGKVIHRQDTYDGPDDLVEAIRQSDPDAKIPADPDLRRKADPLSALKSVPPAAFVLGGAGILCFLCRRKRG